MTLRSLLSAGALITLGMLAGRLLGLLREILIAAQFGTGAEADMAIALLIIPDFITAALLGSAASAALVPAFAARSHGEAIDLMWQAMLVSVVAFAGLALIIISQEASIRQLLTGDTEAWPEASIALRLALCSLPLTAATAIATAYLQYRGRFTIPALANAIFNSVIVLALWLIPDGLLVLAGGIIAASLARLLAHMGAVTRTGDLKKKISFSPWQMDGQLLKAYGATSATGLLTLLPHYAPYAVIGLVGGSVALFNYAFKLILLPAMLGQTIIQMVLLPRLVNLRRDADLESHPGIYRMILQLAWIVSLAACLSLTLASDDIAMLLFGYGKMTSDDITQIGKLFALGVWAMPGMLIASVWQQLLYAGGHTRSQLLASLLQSALIFPLCWIGQGSAGLMGVAAAYVAIQWLPVAVLARQGPTLNLAARWLPSSSYIKLSLIMLAAFIPPAALYHLLAPLPLAGLILAGLIGFIVLAIGLVACTPARQALAEALRQRSAG
jgi:putative peptidoglycan lipid II flippase